MQAPQTHLVTQIIDFCLQHSTFYVLLQVYWGGGGGGGGVEPDPPKY